jgi:type VI secretion system protein VasJ
LFQAELKNCFSQKEAMILRIALCRMLYKSKRTDMTMPHLDLIVNDIDVYGLENWDPELAVEGLKLVWMVFSKHADTALKENAKAILSRIAKIDPVEAMKLGSP